MKKYLAVAFLAGFGLLNTLEGANIDNDNPMELLSENDSNQAEINQQKVESVSFSEEESSAVISGNDSRPPEIDQWEAEFLGFTEENSAAMIRIFNNNGKEKYESYPLQKLITGKYVHDFAEGISYPIVQQYVNLDNALISEKLLMIGDAFEDLSKGIKQQETRQENQDSLFIETFIQTLQGKKLVIKTEELEKVTVPVYHWNKKTLSHPKPFWEKHGDETLLVKKGGEKPKIKVISSNWKSQDYVNSDEILDGTYSEDKINRTRVKVFDWQFIK